MKIYSLDMRIIIPTRIPIIRYYVRLYSFKNSNKKSRTDYFSMSILAKI